MTVQPDGEGSGRDVRCAPELVLLALDAANREDALRALAGAAAAAGYAEPSLPDALIAREREFPTALPTIVPVAIPHADAEHVRRPGLGLATLAHPIEFIQMGSEDSRLDVAAIFMPLVTEPKRQTAFLARLVDVLQQDEWKARIDLVSSPEAAARLINELLYRH